MKDLIERQTAIDALNNILANYVPYLHGLTECIPLDCAVAIKALPSVQQEIIACGSGELVQEPDGLVKDLVKDCISRQAAIDAVKSYWKNEVDRIPKESTDFDVFTQMCDSILTHNANICKAIDKLPSAQYSDAYKAGFNKGYEKAKKEMERQVFVTSDGKVHTITTTWLGDFSPYTCKHCGYHVDSRTKYCPECGRKAVQNVDESDRGKSE